MKDKTVIITGSNSGIGKATAFELAKKGAKVILACRNYEEAEKTKKEIEKLVKGAQVETQGLDLASSKSIKLFVKNFLDSKKNLDVLINNAAVYTPNEKTTLDGFERQMGVNYFGHFLLTKLLLEILKNSPSPPSRILFLSSKFSKYGSLDLDRLEDSDFSVKSYYNSKLAINYFAKELSKKLDTKKVCVYCLSPGFVRTNLGRNSQYNFLLKILLYPLLFLLTKSPEEGSQTVIYCACSSELLGETGCYYTDCKKVQWNDASTNPELGQLLYEKTEQILKLH